MNHLKTTRITNISKKFEGKEPQISLLTDFGHDESVYAVKSAARYVHSNARLEDICHNVPLGNILVGAWRLRRAVTLPTEKEGTIYVGVVDPGVGTERKGIIILTKTGKFLVGPDNGLLSLAAKDEKIEKVVAIENRKLTLLDFAKSQTFHGKDMFAPVAAHLAEGVPIHEFGSVLDPEEIKKIVLINKSTTRLRIGSVVDIDSFGTIRTTIPNAIPEHLIGRSVPFTLSTGEIKKETTARLVRTFGVCKNLEPALVLSSTGSIDLAVNMRSAAETFGFGYGDIGLDGNSPKSRVFINLATG